jgi:hypothetical protein
VQPLWKVTWRFLKKLKIEPTYNLMIPLLSIYPKQKLSIYPKECKSVYNTETYMPIFIAIFITIAKL